MAETPDGVIGDSPAILAWLGEDPRAEAELAGWLERFEALLSDRPFLLGDELGIADVVAFPFLKYPVLGLAPDDTHPEWVARVDAYPRA